VRRPRQLFGLPSLPGKVATVPPASDEEPLDLDTVVARYIRRIQGTVDLDGEPRRHFFMIRATIETFGEVTEHRFEGVAAEVGFPHASHLAWGDYDRDGFEDVLLFGRTMLRNSGPPDCTFTDVTGAIGIGGPYIGGR
jgi:hypothetical protein